MTTNPEKAQEHLRDLSLVTAIQRDPESQEALHASGELFGRYRPKLVNFAIQAGGVSVHEAEDAAQLALVSAWKSIEDFDPDLGTFSSWVIAIVRNKCIDEHKSRGNKIRSSSHPTDPSILDEIEGSVSATGFDTVVFADSLKKLQSKLKPDQVKLLLYDLIGVSNSQAAQIEKIPLGTYKARMQRTKKKARQILSDAHETVLSNPA